MKSSGQFQKVFRSLKAALISLMFYVPILQAQEPHVQTSIAPPPAKVISQTERKEIEEAKDSKARLRVTMTLAENHLLKAEQETGQHNYEMAARELGNYWALIENALIFLRGMSPDRDKTRDLYKRLELALRAHGPRLTSVRRTTPLEYAVWIKNLEEFARKGRTEALDSFYGNTVLREAQQKPLDRTKKLDKGAGPGDKPQ